MKNTLTFLLLSFCTIITAQSDSCKSWETEFDSPPFFGECENQLSEFEFCTVDNLNKFLNDRGYGEFIFNDFEPTKENISVNLSLRIDTLGNVSIFRHTIEGDFPKDLEEYLLYDVGNLKGWSASEIKGKKVCAHIDLMLNCFLEPEIYKTCDIMPRFPGCEDPFISDEEKESCGKQKLLEFVYKNLEFPEDERDRIDGMIVVQFVVDKEGNTNDITVVRSLNKACDKKAVEVVSSFPKWIPGEHDGKKVNVLYTLPIRMKRSDWDR